MVVGEPVPIQQMRECPCVGSEVRGKRAKQAAACSGLAGDNHKLGLNISRAWRYSPGRVVPAPGFRGEPSPPPGAVWVWSFGRAGDSARWLGKTCQTCAGRRKSRVADLVWGLRCPSGQAASWVAALLQFGLSQGSVWGGGYGKRIRCLGCFPGLSPAALEGMQPSIAERRSRCSKEMRLLCTHSS